MTTDLAQTLLEAKIQSFEAQARQAELFADQLRGKASRSLSFFGEVSTGVGAVILANLMEWQFCEKSNQEKLPIFMALNSMGGSSVDSFAIVDYINWMRKAGHNLAIQVTGLAASQAVTVLQSADRRVITPQSWLMLTEQDLRAFHGDSANSEEKIDFLRGLELQGWQLIAERSHVTVDQIKERTAYGRQWWIPAEEALTLGLVDEVGVVATQQKAPAEIMLPQPGDSLETRKLKAKIRLENAKATVLSLSTQEIEQQDDNRLLFSFPVTREFVLVAQRALEHMSRRRGSAIEIIINSPGGSVSDGLSLVDTIKGLQRSGHHVTISILGMAASMAGVISQVADHRVIGANGRILIHRVSQMFSGGGSQVADQMAMMSKVESQVMPLLASRSKLSAEEVYARCEHRDWWLTAEEALEFGFVDEIR